MHDTDIRIRDADSNDSAAIAAMVHRLAASTRDAQKCVSTADDFRRHGFSGNPCFFALIAERGAVPVGLSLWLYEFSSWRGRPGAYLQDLYVVDELRGSGLGRLLLAATSRRAIEHGADHLRLSVATDNEAARAFYAHLGFTYRDDERIYQVADAALASLAEGTKEPGL